ncbi:MAG TPA: sensor histidine kinase KdpD [Anaerovoracaceae bacterium]|nr:sensor histidine kinase KdpD [Anaerovoracaceae bacterium]
MISDNDHRPDPDALLEAIRSDQPEKKGKLKIFLGYAAGVGKTYSMLDDAHEKLKSGVDVVAGYIEPHSRPETMRLLEGIPTLPPKVIRHRNIWLKDFDLDAAIERKPELILVDELAHTNLPEMRNKKRWQDIEELLNAGIDVYTTVNIQHIESLNDIVQKFTKVIVRETVPDSFFDRADTVEIIDFPPDELLKRFAEGKVYRPARAEAAMQSFFTAENLRLLREIAMRKAADRISQDNLSESRVPEKIVSTRLLVCVSSSPESAKLVRWTARTAEAFHAPWVAVYVERMANDNETEVQATLDLAKRLGAETVRLNGHDTAVVIAEYARISGITNVVIEKVRRKSPKDFLETDLEDKLISLLPDVEIHIIPGPPHKPYRNKKWVRISENLFFSWIDTLKTAGFLIAATLLCMGLRAAGVGEQNLIMVFILSVLAVSRTTTGYLFGVTASVLSVLLFDFYFTAPYYTMDTIRSDYPITFVIMFLVAIITSMLTVRVKTQVRLSVEREHRTRVLYEINKKLLVTRGLENIVNLTNEYITKLFERSVIFYTRDPADGSIAGTVAESPQDPGASFLNQDDERAVAHWVFVNKKRAGASTDTLMGAGAYYIPMISQAKVLGVIGVSCASGKLEQNSRLFLRMMASQVAMALERQYLSDEQRRIVIESEKEKMRSNLLRAISHDLRTPLTGILGASSAILENGGSLDKGIHDKLLFHIKEDSQWLIRMVENLLSVTRIKEGSMNVAKSPEAAEEIVAEAVRHIRKRFPDRKISVKAPDELLMVPMDGTLIEQVLINLVENAFKHSPADTVVDVEVMAEKRYAIFEVRDQGEGIAAADLPHLFESYAPDGNRSSDSSRGMGIGLSICMTIIKAHGGKLEAANKNEGGAVFRFTLPLEEVTGNE